MTVKMREQLPVQITKMIYQGVGLAEQDGFKIFVYGGLPGDAGLVTITEKKRHYAFARITELTTLSPYRGTAVCPDYPLCGGCQMLEVDYDRQIELKTQVLDDAIYRFYADLQSLVQPVLASDSNVYYRNKMEYSFGTGSEGALILGLKERGRFDHVIGVKHCWLQSDESNAVRTFVTRYFQDRGWTARDPHHHTGDLRHLTLRHSKAHDQYMAILYVSREEPETLADFARTLNDAFPNVVSIYSAQSDRKSDSTRDAVLKLELGAPVITEVFKPACLNDVTPQPYHFRISPHSFFQTNTRQANRLYQEIVRVAQPQPGWKALDLYCGTGTIGLYLAPFVASVLGIEEVESAIEDARLNAAANGITNIDFRVGRVKNILKFEQLEADLIIVDPPRSGLEPKALRRMLDIQPKVIVYVSCNPTTLLRDLTDIKREGYVPELVKPVDMFPNTYHLECIVRLIKATTEPLRTY